MTDVDLAEAIGRAIRDARMEHRWGQRELARRVGTSQSAIARLERGGLRVLRVDLTSRTLEVLGLRAIFDGRTLGLASRREQADVVHAIALGSLARALRRDGWVTQLEVEIGSGRGRGWIDLLAYRDSDRSLLVTECKSQVLDVGGIQRTVSWYGREAWAAATRLGWRPRQASTLLLLLASAENDAATMVNRSALRETFPGPSSEMARWLKADGPAPRPTIGMIDPRSRRSAWLLATWSDGRRTPAPYRDYADAARTLGTPRPRATRTLATSGALRTRALTTPGALTTRRPLPPPRTLATPPTLATARAGPPLTPRPAPRPGSPPRSPPPADRSPPR